MADTPNYSIELPTVGSSVDTWGGLLNDAITFFDGQVKSNETGIAGKLNRTGGTLTGALIGTTATFTGISGTLTGNASTASRLATARSITLTGTVTGTTSFDGAANASLSTSIADSALSIAKTSGLQTALNGKQATGNYVIHASGAGRKITVSPSTPASPATGDVWFDTSA